MYMLTLSRSVSVQFILLFSLVSSGCFYSREISRARRDVDRSMTEVDYGRGLSMTLGPISIRMAKWILRRVDDEDAELASAYLSDVRRVKAGVYKVNGYSDGELSGIPALRRFERNGWELAVRTRDHDESVLIYYRERNESVSDMFVVVATNEELVLAKIEGRLNRLLERAIQDYGPLFEPEELDELSELQFD